jgi:hypothetical protein
MRFVVETCRNTGSDYCSSIVRFRTLADALRAASDQCRWRGHEFAMIVLADDRLGMPCGQHVMATLTYDTGWATVTSRAFLRRRGTHNVVHSGPITELFPSR